MAKNLYSAHLAAGKSAGKYGSSLADALSTARTGIDKSQALGQIKQQNLSAMFATVGTALELGSTIHGGIKEKKKFEKRKDAYVKSEGIKEVELPDDRNVLKKAWDYLSGEEKLYHFQDESGKVHSLSRAGVVIKGDEILGASELKQNVESVDLSGGDVTPVSDEKDKPNKNKPNFVDKIKKSLSTLSNDKKVKNEDDDLDLDVDTMFDDVDWDEDMLSTTDYNIDEEEENVIQTSGLGKKG
jgi:hypothetical protein